MMNETFKSRRFSHFTDREVNILYEALNNYGNGNTYMSYEIAFERAKRGLNQDYKENKE